jgi:hypothetical protein
MFSHQRLAIIVSMVCASTIANVIPAFAGNDSLQWLPPAPVAGMTMNLTQGRKSAVFMRVATMVKDKAGATAKTMEAFNIDMAQNVNSVTCGAAKKTGSTQPYVCVIEGNFAKVKGLTNAANAQDATVTTSDGTDFVLIGNHLIVSSEGEMKEALLRATGKSQGANKSKSAAWLRSAMAQGLSGRTMWLGFVPDDDQRSKMKEVAGAAGSWVAFSIKAGANVTAEIKTNAGNEKDADAMVAALTKLIDEQRSRLTDMNLTGLSSSLVADRKAAVVRVFASASAKEIETLVTVLKMLL